LAPRIIPPVPWPPRIIPPAPGRPPRFKRPTAAAADNAPAEFFAEPVGDVSAPDTQLPDKDHSVDPFRKVQNVGVILIDPDTNFPNL
jgi:hypothetical protein